MEVLFLFYGVLGMVGAMSARCGPEVGRIGGELVGKAEEALIKSYKWIREGIENPFRDGASWIPAVGPTRNTPGGKNILDEINNPQEMAMTPEQAAKVKTIREQRSIAEAGRKLMEGVKQAEAEGKIKSLEQKDQDWLNADPTGRRKLLAFDPDQKKFQVQEARAAIEAETKGILKSPIRRAIDEYGSSRGGDYIDGDGVHWDIKDAKAGADDIVRIATPSPTNLGEHVLVDCTHLTHMQQQALEMLVRSKLQPNSKEVRFVR
jgi:hypothetical protein